MAQKKNLFSFSNFVTVLLIGLIISMIMFPDVKATMIKGLMKIGLFQPKVSKPETDTTVHISKFQNLLFKKADGTQFDLASLQNKVVVLNFWATWCPPCRAEMPSILDFYEKKKTDPNFELLLVDADAKPEAANKFLRDKRLNLRSVTPLSGLPSALFGGSLPTTVVFDKKGNVVFRQPGAMDFNSQDWNRFIDNLIALK